MEKGAIFRYSTGDQGTLGILVLPYFQCYTLELPWRNNERNISCIPAEETYTVRFHVSPRFGKCFWFTDVLDRTWILTHVGNWAGDIHKGYRTNSNGCILVGEAAGWLADQRAVLRSRSALNSFLDNYWGKKFYIKIINLTES